MALNKIINTRYLVTAEYHKIIQINISWHYKVCDVQLVSYKDKDARDNAAMYLETHSFYWAELEFDFDPELNLTSQIYAKIKQMEGWTDATDC